MEKKILLFYALMEWEKREIGEIEWDEKGARISYHTMFLEKSQTKNSPFRKSTNLMKNTKRNLACISIIFNSIF